MAAFDSRRANRIRAVPARVRAGSPAACLLAGVAGLATDAAAAVLPRCIRRVNPWFRAARASTWWAGRYGLHDRLASWGRLSRTRRSTGSASPIRSFRGRRSSFRSPATPQPPASAPDAGNERGGRAGRSSGPRARRSAGARAHAAAATGTRRRAPAAPRLRSRSRRRNPPRDAARGPCRPTSSRACDGTWPTEGKTIGHFSHAGGKGIDIAGAFRAAGARRGGRTGRLRGQWTHRLRKLVIVKHGRPPPERLRPQRKAAREGRRNSEGQPAHRRHGTLEQGATMLHSRSGATGSPSIRSGSCPDSPGDNGGAAAFPGKKGRHGRRHRGGSIISTARRLPRPPPGFESAPLLPDRQQQRDDLASFPAEDVVRAAGRGLRHDLDPDPVGINGATTRVEGRHGRRRYR